MIEGSVQGQAHWMHSKQLKATEKNLELIFHKFDDNDNGTLDVEEARLVRVCASLALALRTYGAETSTLTDSASCGAETPY